MPAADSVSRKVERLSILARWVCAPKTRGNRLQEDESTGSYLAFDCGWEGLSNPAEITKGLGMDEKAVARARKRLDRRWAKPRGKARSVTV